MESERRWLARALRAQASRNTPEKPKVSHIKRMTETLEWKVADFLEAEQDAIDRFLKPTDYTE